MQVNQPANLYQGSSAEKNTPAGAGSKTKGAFDRALQTARKDFDSGPDAGGPDRVKLGTVSAENPTVSHLMTDHPEYGDDCWQIIHSQQNHDKPYTQIPEGTEIYLDRQTGEISWQGSDSTGRDKSARYKNKPPRDAGSMQVIEESISRAAEKHNLSRELIAGVIRAESGFDASAVSRAGARGLMQLMPQTARELGVSDSFDIRENIDAGARYLKKMLDIFSGSLEKALAAYNAGPEAVKRFSGDVPYTETRQYVARVLSFLDGNSQ
ncbi:MAG: lytic transglycosylase domain-containing protein [Desulfosalsimonas sp.]